MTHILIDWNSTIQNQKAGIIQYVADTHGVPLSDSDFSEWDIDLSHKIGISKEEWLAVWTNEQIFRNAPPYPYAKEALEKLAARHQIIILTSCACGPDVCQWWFNYHQIPYTQIIWTKNKCHYGGLLIDDSPTVLAARYEQRLMTMAFHQGWNRDFTTFPKIFSWQQIAC